MFNGSTEQFAAVTDSKETPAGNDHDSGDDDDDNDEDRDNAADADADDVHNSDAIDHHHQQSPQPDTVIHK